MEVFVKVPMTNEIFAIEVGYNETVMSVKEKIEAETEYKNSKLFFEGVELPDSEELVAHGVAEGDELVTQFEQGVLNRLEKEMYEAVTLERVDVLKKNYLLGINNDLTFRSASLLHLAAVFSKLGSIETLLSLGADVNARNLTTKATPLHNAALSAHPTVVELLLSAGADPKARDRRNNNALHYAVRNRYYYSPVITMLLSAGTPIDQQNVRLRTPAHIASNVDSSVLDVLVRAGCDITLTDNKNRPVIVDPPRYGGYIVLGDYADSIDAVVHAPSKGSVVEEPWEKSNGYARRHCRGAPYREVTRPPKRTYPYNPMSVRIRMGFNPHVGERHVAKEVGFSGLRCAARSSAVSYLDAAKK
eukprot:TRINITY_DN3897_c4_g1_i1.p1 TRINITY_DN3897_c4_g1~~TRINITY_DN3897_c4_g1_i1.p1  ORF type:complete len:381 (+),score=55.61 TRINITY_DN3897_c4_g1_i1:64-1143(+)